MTASSVGATLTKEAIHILFASGYDARDATKPFLRCQNNGWLGNRFFAVFRPGRAWPDRAGPGASPPTVLRQGGSVEFFWGVRERKIKIL